jgi:hypothetical protein
MGDQPVVPPQAITNPKPQQTAMPRGIETAESDEKKMELKVATAALIVSIIAVLFSQIRPLHELFDKPDLGLAVSPAIESGHTLGHLELSRYLTFSNTGHRAGTVVRTELFIMRLDADGFEKILPAAFVASQPPQFFANPGSVRVPWHPVTIAADGDSPSYVTYSQPWPQSDKSASGALLNQAFSELNKVNGDKGLAGGGQITDETFKALESFVDKSLAGFGTGEFGVLTYFWGKESAEPKIDKCDVINISDSEMNGLHDSIINKYRTGQGLVYPYGGPIPTILSNTRACDDNTLNKMKARLDAHKPL